MKIDTKDLGYKAMWGAGVLGTLAAPVTTGYVIARNLIEVKEFDWRFALTAALAVETMGFTAATVGLAHYDQDNRAGKRFGSLPTWLSVIALVAYVAVAITLTYVIENDLTLALFPLLSLVGSMILALVQELKRRTTVISDNQAQQELDRQVRERREAQQMQLEAAQRAERDRLLAERQARLDQLAHEEKLAEITARKEAKIAKLQQAQLRAQKAQPSVQQEQPDELRGNRKAIYDMLQATPHATPTQVGMQLGITRQAASKHIEWLVQQGLISRNGNGNHQEQEG